MIPKDLSVDTIKDVYKRLSNFVIETPILENSQSINKLLSTNAIFKLEFLQNSGTFKARGATNNILKMTNKQKKNGITAVSAGNHAIASSYVSDRFKIKNKIFMYNSANQYRINKCKELNANIILTEPHEAFKKVDNASKEEGFFFIHPFDGINTLQGTASLGLEICNQVKNFQNILISVGGGGLISGIGSIIKQINPNCNIYGIEPEGARGLSDSLIKDTPLKNIEINTVADSLSAPLHMEYSFSVAKKVIDKMITVTDKEMIESMLFMFENFKLILEPGCVAGIAALLGPLKNKLKNQNTLILLCGSNIDSKSWNELVFQNSL